MNYMVPLAKQWSLGSLAGHWFILLYAGNIIRGILDLGALAARKD